jgi:hypothetical protein
VILKYSDFIRGPLGSYLFNKTAMMKKNFEFQGTISDLSISKLYKRVSTTYQVYNSKLLYRCASASQLKLKRQLR